MIVIFTEDDDYSTTKVMEYLFHWGEEVLRVNKQDTLKASVRINIANGPARLEMTIGGVLLIPETIKSIWFRRGGYYINNIQNSQVKKNKAVVRSQLIENLTGERSTLSTFIYEVLLRPGKRVLGNPLQYNTKKLSILEKALEYGLDIPETLVTTEKQDLVQFLRRKGAVITKSIQDNVSIQAGKGNSFVTYTEEIDAALCGQIPESFLPSLFQEKLDKKYEIRTFFLDGAFFSVAIFSQENERTRVDFKKYDLKIPNRKTCIRLPGHIEKKLKSLLADLQLNTASIDIVVTNNNRFVFLEINPVGQYDMVGKLMNYQLDKQIATWLAQK